MVDEIISFSVGIFIFFRVLYLLLIKKSFLLYLRDVLGIIFFVAFFPYLVKYFFPFAYAGVVEVYTALATSIPESQKFINVILNTLAMAIPTALGGGALFLVGRDFYMASQKAIAESLFTAKMLGFMASRGLSALSNKFPVLDDGGGGSAGTSKPELSKFLSNNYANYVNGLDDVQRDFVLRQLEATFKHYGTPQDLQKFYKTYFPNSSKHLSGGYFV